MTKRCAYCGGPPPLTREHIWPNGFLKRGSFEVKYSARAKKTFTGDLTIADVCGPCNNVALSKLDAHACELFDRRFSKFVEHGETVVFTYDYGLLMRWLLKTSYNSARGTGEDVALLGSYRHAIISEDACSPIFVVAFIATVSPSLMPNRDTGERRKIYPMAARSGRSFFSAKAGDDEVVARTVMINSFFFTLLITRDSTISANHVRYLASQVPGVPLALGGRMRIGAPSLSALVALGGVEKWPGLREAK